MPAGRRAIVDRGHHVVAARQVGIERPVVHAVAALPLAAVHDDHGRNRIVHVRRTKEIERQLLVLALGEHVLLVANGGERHRREELGPDERRAARILGGRHADAAFRTEARVERGRQLVAFFLRTIRRQDQQRDSGEAQHPADAAGTCPRFRRDGRQQRQQRDAVAELRRGKPDAPQRAVWHWQGCRRCQREQRDAHEQSKPVSHQRSGRSAETRHTRKGRNAALLARGMPGRNLNENAQCVGAPDVGRTRECHRARNRGVSDALGLRR